MRALTATVSFMLLALALMALSTRPALAQAEAEPRAGVLEFYCFDPAQGKQERLDSFNWPANRQISALLRYETEGYSRRKTVQLFFVISDASDRVVTKEEIELNLHSGEHEYVLPLDFAIGEQFGEQRLKLDAEVKLVGANRDSERIEIVSNGPQLPTIVIGDMRLEHPDGSGMITALSPGQAFRLVGTVSVSGNESALLPRFMVWGLMNADKLTVDVFEEKPFSDMYWDWAQLPQKNGKWRFALEGLMPTHFLPNPVESQPFTLSAAVAFTPEALGTQTLGGTVLASGSGGLVSEDLDERLIFIERNWHWKITPMD